ncbi:hypothetical protein J5N97_024650 [Dioscorea zingiberensis]|uniref:Uncharacterized protein n=1 Tax=Dioscorea zingiberensis TaxID=325984 RepID=A0A9D5C7J7_9LILI|nr:hypothetical protein J5N97_024650 [Dioscorea zingiberensis]
MKGGKSKAETKKAIIKYVLDRSLVFWFGSGDRRSEGFVLVFGSRLLIKKETKPKPMSLCTPAMTSKELVEKDFEQIGEFLHQAVITITMSIQKEYGKLLKDFIKGLVNNKD